MSSDWKSWFGFAAIMAAVIAPETGGQPTFRSGVDLVTVDAAVLDGEGRPVTALRAEDFRIEVDGRPRRVVAAQFVDLSRPIDRPALPSAAHFSSNAGAADGRIVVIAVDDAHIRRLEGRPALQAASRFIDGLPAADRIGVIALSSESALTLTRDRVALRSRLGSLIGRGDQLGGQFNLGTHEALEIADGSRARLAEAVLRECGRALTEYVNTARAADDLSSGRDSCPEQLEQQARGTAQYAHSQARMSLAALEGLVARLKDLPGPKTIVLLSEGMIVDPRRIDLAALAAAAQAARVTIYSLVLDIPVFDATQERVSPGAERDRQVREDGVDRVAGAARGAMFRQVGADAAPSARIMRELSGHYLLAFEAADRDRDARPHRIRVALNEGRHQVRARTHFTVPAATLPARGAQLSALLRSLSPVSEVPLRVATFTYAEPARRALRVVISAEAGAGDGAAGAWLGFVLVDAAGIIAATATVESQSGQYAFSAVVAEGRYTLRAAAIDRMGLQGSVERAFTAQLAGATDWRFGDLMLAPVPASPAAALQPIVDRASGDALVAYLEFQATDAARSAPVRVTIARGPSEPPVLTAAAAVSIRADGWAAARATIPIRDLPPGAYLASVEIDVPNAPAGGMSRPFTIATR